MILGASRRSKNLILAEWPVGLVKRQYIYEFIFSPECLNTRYPVEDHDWLVDTKCALVSGSCILPLQTDHLPKIAALKAHKIESER